MASYEAGHFVTAHSRRHQFLNNQSKSESSQNQPLLSHSYLAEHSHAVTECFCALLHKSIALLELDIRKGLKAGFFPYITKPIMVNELMEALNVALEFEENRV
jgi:CheY-like chemotaxis protein